MMLCVNYGTGLWPGFALRLGPVGADADHAAAGNAIETRCAKGSRGSKLIATSKFASLFTCDVCGLGHNFLCALPELGWKRPRRPL
jgi:hypothetical protein